VDDNGATLTARGLVIPDCRLDDRFKNRPYVTSDPGIRFYAGVPIYSRNGYMIGAVAVSDEDARAALKIEELKLMQETAQSVIEHLECKSLSRGASNTGCVADAVAGMLSLAARSRRSASAFSPFCCSIRGAMSQHSQTMKMACIQYGTSMLTMTHRGTRQSRPVQGRAHSERHGIVHRRMHLNTRRDEWERSWHWQNPWRTYSTCWITYNIAAAALGD
jgi:hypothetical protein